MGNPWAFAIDTAVFAASDAAWAKGLFLFEESEVVSTSLRAPICMPLVVVDLFMVYLTQSLQAYLFFVNKAIANGVASKSRIVLLVLCDTLNLV